MPCGGSFQVYNTVTRITTLPIRSPELSHLLTESFYPLTNISPLAGPPQAANHHFPLCLHALAFVDSTCKGDDAVFVFRCLPYCT